MKKSLRMVIVKRYGYDGCSTWSPAMFDGKKNLGRFPYNNKKAAIRRTKFLARIIGVPFDPEIIKEHGC